MGHFYLMMNKIGSLKREANHFPWVDYFPDARRLDKFVNHGKITDETWLEYLAWSV